MTPPKIKCTTIPPSPSTSSIEICPSQKSTSIAPLILTGARALDEPAVELNWSIQPSPTHLTTFVSGRKKAKPKQSQSSPVPFPVNR